MTNTENKVFEKEMNKDGQERLKQIEYKDKQNQNIDELNKKIGKIEEKLNRVGSNGRGKDFFIRNMNDYLEEKYGATFEKTKDGKLVLAFNKQDLSTHLDKLSNALNISKNNEVFIDENLDGKKGKNEVGIKIEDKKLETDGIYVSEEELKRSKKDVGFGKLEGKDGVINKEVSKGGKLVYENGKEYYQVGNHKDYLASPVRLLSTINDEYLGGIDMESLKNKIGTIGYKKEGNKIEFGIGDGFIKIKDGFNSTEWKHIVQPGSKIDLKSLSKAITGVDLKIEEVKNIDWGRFYNSLDGEVYDVPDTWTNITYDGYSKKYDNLNGSQISIGAKSTYDFSNKEKGLAGENTFSLKEKIKIGGEVAYLIAGETSNDKIKGLVNGENSIDGLKNALKDSKTEAWIVMPGEKGKATITEVGDERVHTITETSDKVERGEDKEHPIVLTGTEYKFNGEVDGSIKFKEEKGKIDFKNPKIEGLASKNFDKVFPGGIGFLQVEGYLVKISLDKDKKIKVEDLGKQKNENLNAGGVSILSSNFSGFEFNKENGYVKFPALTGWGKIEGNIIKEKVDGKDNLKIDLSDNYKIGDRKLNINLGENVKLKPSEIQSKIVAGLLYLEINKDKLLNPLGANNNIKIEDKKINISLPDKLKDIQDYIKTENKKIFTYEEGENKDTYIFDQIKKDIGASIINENTEMNKTSENIDTIKISILKILGINGLKDIKLPEDRSSMENINKALNLLNNNDKNVGRLVIIDELLNVNKSNIELRELYNEELNNVNNIGEALSFVAAKLGFSYSVQGDLMGLKVKVDVNNKDNKIDKLGGLIVEGKLESAKVVLSEILNNSDNFEYIGEIIGEEKELKAGKRALSSLLNLNTNTEGIENDLENSGIFLDKKAIEISIKGADYIEGSNTLLTKKLSKLIDPKSILNIDSKENYRIEINSGEFYTISGKDLRSILINQFSDEVSKKFNKLLKDKDDKYNKLTEVSNNMVIDEQELFSEELGIKGLKLGDDSFTIKKEKAYGETKFIIDISGWDNIVIEKKGENDLIIKDEDGLLPALNIKNKEDVKNYYEILNKVKQNDDLFMNIKNLKNIVDIRNIVDNTLILKKGFEEYDGLDVNRVSFGEGSNKNAIKELFGDKIEISDFNVSVNKEGKIVIKFDFDTSGFNFIHIEKTINISNGSNNVTSIVSDALKKIRVTKENGEIKVNGNSKGNDITFS